MPNGWSIDDGSLSVRGITRSRDCAERESVDRTTTLAETRRERRGIGDSRRHEAVTKAPRSRTGEASCGRPTHREDATVFHRPPDLGGARSSSAAGSSGFGRTILANRRPSQWRDRVGIAPIFPPRPLSGTLPRPNPDAALRKRPGDHPGLRGLWRVGRTRASRPSISSRGGVRPARRRGK